MRRGGLEVVQLAEGVVDRALARGVPHGVEGHSGESVRERREEAGGAAQGEALGSVAARISRSSDAAARASAARARGS